MPPSILGGIALAIIIAMIFVWRASEEREMSLWRKTLRALAWVAAILFLAALVAGVALRFLFPLPPH